MTNGYFGPERSFWWRITVILIIQRSFLWWTNGHFGQKYNGHFGHTTVILVPNNGHFGDPLQNGNFIPKTVNLPDWKTVTLD